MNKKTFLENFALLEMLYGKKMQDEVTALYWNILKAISDEDFKQIVNHVVTHFKPSSQCPFPSPAHFADLILENDISALSSAITEVRKAISKHGPYQSVSFNDPALHDVILRYGGWIELCNWTNEDWRIKERAFLDAYKAAKTCNNGPEYLPGITENENSLTNFTRFIPAPVQVKIGINKRISADSLILEKKC